MRPGLNIALWSSVVLGLSGHALAGGMVLPVRGVRALERAGALIAGADDADALWLDPAGLAHVHGAGTKAFLFDVAYLYHDVTIEPVDTTGAAQAALSNQQPGRAPIPTLAAALALDDRLTIAGGITAPYAALHRYPGDGGQRFASVELAEATYALVTFGAALRISDSLRVGATLQNLVSSIRWSVVTSLCPGTAMCAPDDRTFDALMTVEQRDYISPTGSLGVQYDIARIATLGLAVQGPARVAGDGTLTFQLPASTMFDDAMVTGSDASLGFTLPSIIRAGVEVRPADGLRVEAALAAELWSMHDDISIAPDRMRIEGVQGINAYDVHAMTIARDYKTSFAPALGVEWIGAQAMLGAGISYETAAAPLAHVSPLTVDAGKLLVGLGGGYAADGWQLGGALGYVAVDDVELAVGQARVIQLQPLRDAPAAVIANAGTYRSSYIVAGIRAARRF
jgi:long-chain fatty acid transport protein